MWAEDAGVINLAGLDVHSSFFHKDGGIGFVGDCVLEADRSPL